MGFNKEEYNNYLKSYKWKQIRMAAIIRAGYKCEHCGSTKYLQAHHCHYRTLFNEAPWDLRVLCRECHMFVHGLSKYNPAKHLGDLKLAFLLEDQQAMNYFNTIEPLINQIKEKLSIIVDKRYFNNDEDTYSQEELNNEFGSVEFMMTELKHRMMGLNENDTLIELIKQQQYQPEKKSIAHQEVDDFWEKEDEMKEKYKL